MCRLLLGAPLGRVSLQVLKMKEKMSSVGRKEHKKTAWKSQADLPVYLMEILT